MLCWILGFGKSYKFPCIHYRNLGYRHNQRYNLVNVRLKWVKDSVLDTVVTGERELRAAWVIVSIIAADYGGCLPIYRLSGRRRGQLGLPEDLKISTFMRRYPNIFDEFHVPDTGGTLVPWFRLTPDVIRLNQEANAVFRQHEKDFLDRLCKLLMLTKDMILPLPTIDQLKWDLGLPHDYVDSFIPKYKDVFSLIRLPDDRVALKLISWPNELAVSQLEMNALMQQKDEDVIAGRLGFRIGFPRGYGLKRKSIKWLEEWQRLPYTSPYYDSSHLDSRTDVSEKRIVGVFHELLHLTVQKKTERQNVSNLRKPLNLPQKFTKVFERHPGIFYISKKNNTQTVVLREAYDRHQLVHKHPISEIRDRFACLMKEGFLDRSKGLYKEHPATSLGEDESHVFEAESFANEFESEEESEAHMFSEYESDETTHHFRLSK
ncbi:protein WHAT'S THIS FACTOR 1 [Cynara cardunculus var. scolymus]|uniref:Plant organelle RNA recognition domain-containing protein n=1 Tax=Cynara cardunculus var. scolymus TaxID=59895 RepID=A0A118JQ27_CYNCS|nr:protein WHAT'S THIS FACTOR 1 [Cynara cardunculus var. scolymus]KVH85044.1 Plant organelle RNA recognition domain-containing protein [Cynara cardunculus var. scolymus]